MLVWCYAVCHYTSSTDFTNEIFSAFVFTGVHHLAFIDGQKQENSRLNFFDTDLLRYTAEDKRGNVMISPASIKSTLAMILEGASGSTAAEIRSALRLSPVKEEYREQLNLYLSLLKVV